MNSLNPILLVEDSAKDIELTLAALEDSRFANRVIVMRNDNEEMQYFRELRPRTISTTFRRHSSGHQDAQDQWHRAAS
jgi:hypothetical protein